MFVRSTLFALGLLALTAGCGSTDTADSTDVNENKLYGRYTAAFQNDDKSLRLTTQFRLGGSTGTTIRLNDPSNVTVNDAAMEVWDGETKTINLQGTYYKLESTPAAPADTYTYKWTRSDGTVYANVVTMAKAASITAPAANANVSRASDLTFTASGDDLKADESFYFLLESDTTPIPTGKKGTVSVTVSSGKTGTIAKADLATLVNGTAKLSVRRSRSDKPQSGHDDEGGTLFTEYTSAKVSVTVVD